MKKVFLVIFTFTIVSSSYAYYDELISRDDFTDLFSSNMVSNLSLKYDKRSEDQSSVYFSGSGKISGVLVYHYYLDDVAMPAKWRFIFYPDKQERIDVSDGYSFDTIVLLNDVSNKYLASILSDSMDIPDSEFKKIFGVKFHNGDKYIIGGFAVHVELTINNLQIVNELGYAAQFNSSYIKPTGDVKKWYLDASKTGNTLCLTTEDDYSNLRETPGGKILFKVYKNNLNNDSSMDSEKAYLIEMPSKSSDSKWLPVVFLKAGQSTWETGVFGYIHSSQVEYCEYLMY